METSNQHQGTIIMQNRSTTNGMEKTELFKYIQNLKSKSSITSLSCGMLSKSVTLRSAVQANQQAVSRWGDLVCSLGMTSKPNRRLTCGSGRFYCSTMKTPRNRTKLPINQFKNKTKQKQTNKQTKQKQNKNKQNKTKQKPQVILSALCLMLCNSMLPQHTLQMFADHCGLRQF